MIERDRRGRRRGTGAREGGGEVFFPAEAEECNAAVKTPGPCVGMMSEAAGPWWKHENSIIASLPVGIANKGA